LSPLLAFSRCALHTTVLRNGGSASRITERLSIGEIDRCHAGHGRTFSIFFSVPAVLAMQHPADRPI
jgi:hypothetical protein